MNVVGAGLARGGADAVVGRVGSGQADVVGDGAVEQVRPLRHPRDVRPPGATVDRGERRVADEDPPGVGLDEPEQQVRDGRLARAGRADQGDDAAARDRQVQAVEGRLGPARIGDRDAREPDRRPIGGRGRRRRAARAGAACRGRAGSGSSRIAKTRARRPPAPPPPSGSGRQLAAAAGRTRAR